MSTPHLLTQPEGKTLEFKRDISSSTNRLKRKQWGTGVRRIFSEANTLGLPEPHIEEIGMRLRFTLFLKEEITVSGSISGAQSPTQSPTQSNDPVILLLLQLESGPVSSGELRNRLDLKHRPTFRDNYLHPGMEQGLIEYTLPDKPNSRLQKYRLTPKGKQLLEARK